MINKVINISLLAIFFVLATNEIQCENTQSQDLEAYSNELLKGQYVYYDSELAAFRLQYRDVKMTSKQIMDISDRWQSLYIDPQIEYFADYYKYLHEINPDSKVDYESELLYLNGNLLSPINVKLSEIDLGKGYYAYKIDFEYYLSNYKNLFDSSHRKELTFKYKRTNISEILNSIEEYKDLNPSHCFIRSKSDDLERSRAKKAREQFFNDKTKMLNAFSTELKYAYDIYNSLTTECTANAFVYYNKPVIDSASNLNTSAHSLFLGTLIKIYEYSKYSTSNDTVYYNRYYVVKWNEEYTNISLFFDLGISLDKKDSRILRASVEFSKYNKDLFISSNRWIDKNLSNSKKLSAIDFKNYTVDKIPYDIIYYMWESDPFLFSQPGKRVEIDSVDQDDK